MILLKVRLIEAGNLSNGETVSIKSDGFAATGAAFDNLLFLKATCVKMTRQSLVKVFISITTGLVTEPPINKLTYL